MGNASPQRKKSPWGFARDGNREEILAKPHGVLKFQVQSLKRHDKYRCEMWRMNSLNGTQPIFVIDTHLIHEYG